MLTSLVPTCPRLCGIKKQAIFDDLLGTTINEKFRGYGSSENPIF